MLQPHRSRAAAKTSSVRVGVAVSVVAQGLWICGGAALIGLLTASAAISQTASYLVVMSVTGVAAAIGPLGMPELAAVATASGSGRSRRRQLGLHLQVATVTSCLAAAAAGAVVLATDGPGWAAAAFALSVADGLRNVVLLALHGGGDSVTPSVLGRTTNLAAGIIAVLLGADPLAVVWAQTAAIVVSGLLAAVRFVRVTRGLDGDVVPLRPWRDLVVEGGTVVIASVANITRHRLPVWALAVVGSDVAVVVYGLAAKAGGVLLAPGIAVSVGARSKVAADIDDREELQRLLRPLTRLQAAASVVAAVGLVTLGPAALRVVVPDVSVPWQVLAAIAVGPLAWSWVGDAFWALRLAGHHGALAASSWASWVATAVAGVVLHLAGVGSAVLGAWMLTAGWIVLTVVQQQQLVSRVGVSFAPWWPQRGRRATESAADS